MPRLLTHDGYVDAERVGQRHVGPAQLTDVHQQNVAKVDQHVCTRRRSRKPTRQCGEAGYAGALGLGVNFTMIRILNNRETQCTVE